MRYVVAIGNLLFHIELYCCNRLNLYFTSNFVDVIKVSNWVAGKFGKFALFFIYLFPLSHPCLFLFFFSHLNISLSPTRLFFFSSQFPTFSHHIYLPIFSHLNFNYHPCLTLYFFHLSFPLCLTHLYLLFFCFVF